MRAILVVAAGAMLAGAWLLLGSRGEDAVPEVRKPGADGRATEDGAVPQATATEGPAAEASAPIASEPFRETGPEAVAGTWALAGRVVDEDEKPLARVTVVAKAVPGHDVHATPATRITATTGDDGGFRFLLAPPKAATSFRLSIESATHDAGAKDLTVLEDDPPPDPITLRAVAFQATITGTVRTDTGQPLPGAKVGWVREVTADGTGAYVYPVTLTYPTAYLRARAPGHTGPHQSVQLPKPGGTLVLDFVLEPEGVLEGIVRREDGSPLAGARAWAWASERVSAVTGPDGAFRLAGFDTRQEHHGVRTEAPGFVTTNTPVAFTDRKARVEITLKPGVVLNGFVVSPDGTPVPAARVRFGEEFSSVRREAWTGKDGRFAIDSVPAGPGEIAAWRKDRGEVKQTIAVPPGPDGIRIVLAAGREVAGRVVDEAGLPIASISLAGKRGMNYLEARARTDADGRFTIGGLPPEEKSLALEVYGRGWLRAQHPVPPDRRDLVIVMKKNGKLAGTVLDAATRAPVPRFRVRIVAPELQAGDRGNGGGYSTTWSDDGHLFETSDGVWRIAEEDLRPGEMFGIEVRAEGHATATLPRVAAETDPDPAANVLLMLSGARLAGRVVTPRDEPVAGAALSVQPAERMKGWQMEAVDLPSDARTDADGAFDLAGAPAGDVMIVVRSAHAPAFAAGPFKVAAGGVADGLRIVVPDGGAITGTVLAPDGRPASGGRVVATVRGGAALVRESRTALGSGGRFELKGLAAGTYDVGWCEGDSWWPCVGRAVSVEAGATREVQLSFDGPCSLRLVVEHEGPLPPGIHAMIEPWSRLDAPGIHRQQQRRRLVLTADETTVGGLDAGPIRIDILAGGRYLEFDESNRAMTLAPGSVPVVRFRIP